jgi:transposase-like protein
VTQKSGESFAVLLVKELSQTKLVRTKDSDEFCRNYQHDSTSESEETWGQFFRGLQERGLRGVKLVVSDDHKGLTNALEKYFQGLPWQRCQVHFMRNLLTHLGKANSSVYMGLLQDVFASRTLEEAHERGKILAENRKPGQRGNI